LPGMGIVEADLAELQEREQLISVPNETFYDPVDILVFSGCFNQLIRALWRICFRAC
jgi:hypothetical protein